VSDASSKVQVEGSKLNVEGLIASITAMERAQVDLDRAVVITGIGALLADDIRERLVRMRVEAQRVKVGMTNSQKASNRSKVQVEGSKLAVPVSVYVMVRCYGGAYIARTSPPAANGRASSTSSAQLAAIAAARKAVPNGITPRAYEDGGGIWRVEFSVTS
jgi:hypothetical protein